MTRKELIESREYLKATIDCLLNGMKKKQRKKVRNLMINFMLEHRAEWLEINKTTKRRTPSISIPEIEYRIDDEEWNAACRAVSIVKNNFYTKDCANALLAHFELKERTEAKRREINEN